MPASTLEPVDAALRQALQRDDGPLDKRLALAAAAKKALLAEVEFEPAGTYQSTVLDKLKNKYIVLKSGETPQPSKPEGDTEGDETLKLASRELFPLEGVQLGWSRSDWSVGAGMINMGNTCYLNSTLQALFHVPALVNWLMSDQEHSADCQDSANLCIVCAMRKTLQESQQRTVTSIRPLLIYNKLRLVCRNLIPGRQEDAHEFLRYLVEAMEKAFLGRFKNGGEFDCKVKETTPLNQILGGYLRSAVRCLKCGHVSTTFQHFQDLLLDVRKAQTLDEALEGYFAREKLDDDSYHCAACQKKVPATKQFFLERTPMVLCVQLKRFSVSNNKITKHVNFRQRLDLTRYARHRPSVPLVYRLVALVTHMGPTVNCGHYTAVAQAPNGSFYQFDDSMVRGISHQAVFNTNAYIMLYELESSPFAPKTTATVAKAKSPTPTEASAATSKVNGVGYTSEKPYGPELPPLKVDDTNSTQVNGTKPEEETPRQTETVLPPDRISPSAAAPNNVVSQAGNVTENGAVLPKDANGLKLVPYETDDSSGSDETEYRVSTKAAVGDWKVTPVEPGSNLSNGSKKENSVAPLYKMSHNGYGAPVTSWNGTRANLDKEIQNERREDRKRSFGDHSDHGKAKHQKINYKSNPGYNPVQEYHNNKNWGFNRFYSNRYRRNFNHKNFHKNYRFRQ